MMPFYNVKILHSAKPNTQAFKQANGKTTISSNLSQDDTHKHVDWINRLLTKTLLQLQRWHLAQSHSYPNSQTNPSRAELV